VLARLKTSDSRTLAITRPGAADVVLEVRCLATIRLHYRLYIVDQRQPGSRNEPPDFAAPDIEYLGAPVRVLTPSGPQFHVWSCESARHLSAALSLREGSARPSVYRSIASTKRRERRGWVFRIPPRYLAVTCLCSRGGNRGAAHRSVTSASSEENEGALLLVVHPSVYETSTHALASLSEAAA
jgi:hypothetical protein